MFLVLVVSVISVVSVAAVTFGGAATVALVTLDEGLPDVRAFRDIDFNEQSIMYARDGKTQLAEFWDERREVIEFKDIPRLVLDATTAVEDDTFWDNPGVDLQATVNALLQEAAGGSQRGGGSTITQQLVRARLLPEDVLDAQFESKEALYTRKAKEILQAYKLTQAFPGEKGKEEIITAYLNEIPYGGPIHGIAAAADVYLGKKLDELTTAEAALLAAIPQEPANLRPYAVNKKGKYTNVRVEKYGKKNKKTGKQKKRLVIRACGGKADCVDSELVRRQHFILDRLADGKGRWSQPSDEQIAQAKKQKIIVKPERRIQFKAPQFVEAARKELELIIGDRDPLQVGGYTIRTTLDMRAQEIGSKYVWAGAIAPNLPLSQYYTQTSQRGLGRDRFWIDKLRPLGVRNGALVAMDYQKGDVLAYVASADPYRTSNNPKFDPEYDHIGLAKRQPGSAWKPIVYATGLETKRLTAGSILLDITTPFGGRSDDGSAWAPKNADSTDSGPIQVRDALQQSLNVPAIRALDRVGVKTVRKYAVKAGFEFLEPPVGFGNKALDVAGLAGAIGTVEVRPLDMVAAFGAFGNSGRVTRPRFILEVTGPKGEQIYKAGRPVTTQVWSPQTAYIMADILKGNTDPAENAAWANIFELRNTRDGSRREAAVKTGTTNNLRDYSTYGFLPKPSNPKQAALAVGVWYGNSDHSQPALLPIYSLDNAGRTWHAFVRDYMNKKPTSTFKPPKTGVVTATIKTVTGGARQELFIRGTQPGGNQQVDPGYTCGASITSLENPGAPSTWLAAVNAWAARGVGGSSQWGSVKTSGSGCFSGPSVSVPSGESSDSSSGSNGSSGSSGGGNKPAPTCQPGFTDKPRGCVIPQ